MLVDQRRDCTFLNDTAQSERAARESLRFIIANKKVLLKTKKGEKYLLDAFDMERNTEGLSPKQKSYIDVIYEATMAALGFDSFKTTYKPNPKTFLRYGGKR